MEPEPVTVTVPSSIVQDTFGPHLPPWIGVKVNVGSEEDMTLVPDLLYMARSRSRLVTVVASATAAALAAALLVVAVVVVRQRRRLFRSRTIIAERRERPQLLFNDAGIPTHLYTGVLYHGRTWNAVEAIGG